MKARSNFLSISILTLLVILAFAPFITAQDGGPVELAGPAQSVIADPGDIATLVYQLQNNAENTIRFDLELTLPEDVLSLAPLAPITLLPGGEENIFVTLVIGRSAMAGPSEILLRAVPNTTPLEPIEAVGILEISSIANLEIVAPPMTTTEPGSRVELLFTLANRGNSPDRYMLEVISTQDIGVELDLDEIELLAGEERDVVVSANVPSELAGEQIRITLKAISLSQDALTMAFATIDVLPALPSQIGGSTSLKIPSTLALNFFSDPPSPLVITELLSGGVSFESGFTFSYRILLRGLTLNTFRLQFENDFIGTTLGDLSLSLTPLIGLSGRGASLTVQNLLTETSPSAAIGLVRSSDILIYGGRAQFTVLGLTTTLGARIRPSLEELIAGGEFQGAISQLGTFTINGAFSRDAATELGKAIRIAQSFDFERFNVNLLLGYGDPNFLGNLRDSLSLSIGQMLSTTGLSVRTSFSFARNNVLDDPAITTIANTGASASLTVPITTTTDIATEFGFKSSIDVAPVPTVNLQTFSLSTRLTQQLGALRLSAVHERTRTRDLILNIDQELTVWRSITDLDLGAFDIQIRIGLIQNWDVIHDILLANYIETLISSRVNFSIADLQFTVERLPALTQLSATISADLNDLTFSSRKTLSITDTGDLDFSINLNAVVRFNLPIPFIQIKGRLEGVIYSDENGNGVRDNGEAGLNGVVLSVNGQLVRTDDTGFFRSQPLDRGEVKVLIVSLPAGYVAPQEEMLFIIGTGQVIEVEIPVRGIGFIRGALFEDLNENGVMDAGERGLSNVLLLISGENETIERRTTALGQFSLEVEMGQYDVRVDESTLPGRFQLTTPALQQVDVGLGQIANVQFGAVEVLEFRFAPIADFSFMPEAIKVGDVVTFNGSLSLDSDGEIVSYEWDFNDDGMVDATGQIVTTTFSMPGDVPVTLTVTDNDGQRDSTTQTLPISPQAPE